MAQSWPAACGWSWAPSGSSSSCPRGILEPPCLGHDGAGACRAAGLTGETVRAGVSSPGPGGWDRGPPGPGCEARPSVAATINMFVQGKPGWELCALAWRGRKGCLCLAHWGDCSSSRNCCPVAGKVRRPLGPVGSKRCLRPLCLLPAVRLVHPHHLWALAQGQKVPGKV